MFTTFWSLTKVLQISYDMQKIPRVLSVYRGIINDVKQIRYLHVKSQQDPLFTSRYVYHW